MLADIKTQTIRLLRWSERYTKTDMVFLASRGSFSIVTQVITALATLAFAIVVGHVLSKETYGEYKYVLSIVALLSFFSLNNIGGAIFQSTAKGFGGALPEGFSANIRWSAAVFVGALGFAVYYFALHNVRLGGEILIGGMLAPWIASAGLYNPYLAGKRAFLRQMFYTIGDNLFTTGVMIAAVVLTKDPFMLVIAYFVSNLLGALFFYFRTAALYRVHEEARDEHMLTFSKHLSVLGILGGIVDILDQILVFHFAGAAQLAVFSFATALPDQLKTPVKTLDTMLSSGYARRSKMEIHKGMANKFFWYLLFALSAIVLYIVAAPFIFKVLFPAYMGSVFYSQIYVFWLLGMVLDPIQSYFGINKMLRQLYISGIFSIVLQTVTMVLGIIWFGILGLIMAQVFTKIAASLLAYILYRFARRGDSLAAGV